LRKSQRNITSKGPFRQVSHRKLYGRCDSANFSAIFRLPVPLAAFAGKDCRLPSSLWLQIKVTGPMRWSDGAVIRVI